MDLGTNKAKAVGLRLSHFLGVLCDRKGVSRVEDTRGSKKRGVVQSVELVESVESVESLLS